MSWEPLIRLPPAWTSVLGNFGVHLFEGHLSLEQMDQMQSEADRWLAQRRSKLVELVVIHPSDARMNIEERARMARLIKLGERRRTASATVILADGLVGSVQRSVLTGLTMLVPAPHPVKVFGEVEAAVSWLFPYLQALSGDAHGINRESNVSPLPQLAELQASLAAHITEFRARSASSHFGARKHAP